jgi:DNA mismatch repair ATPase MutL
MYVDDILIIYSTQYTNIDDTLQEFNTVHPELKFMLEKETQNKINYLNLTINKEHDKLSFGIDHKPTTTDTIIHNNLCHLHEHKKISY